MKPILWEMGPVTIYAYGVMVALGFLVAYLLFKREALRHGYSESQVGTFSVIVLFSGLLGARALFVMQHLDFYAENPPEIFWLHHGGLVWYGAFLGGLIGGIWYLRTKGLSFWKTADLVLPYVVLAQALGRVGCFLNGCCYGIHANETWGVTFPHEELPRLPVQLYTAAALLVLALILIRLLHRNPPRGFVASAYGVGYALVRFHVEFLRADNPEFFLGLTLPQVMSVGLLLASVFALRFLIPRLS